MPDVKGAGGVGADKFDLDFLAGTHVRKSIAFVKIMNLLQDRVPGGLFHVKIEKPGPGNIRAGNHSVRIIEVCDDGFGYFARRHFLYRGHDHGDIGREITMGPGFGLFNLRFGYFR